MIMTSGQFINSLKLLSAHYICQGLCWVPKMKKGKLILPSRNNSDNFSHLYFLAAVERCTAVCTPEGLITW